LYPHKCIVRYRHLFVLNSTKIHISTSCALYKICNHRKLRGLITRRHCASAGVSATAHQLVCPPCFYFSQKKFEKVRNCCRPDGKIFTPNFIKIGQLVQNFNWRKYTHTKVHFTRLLLLLMKGMCVRFLPSTRNRPIRKFSFFGISCNEPCVLSWPLTQKDNPQI
jgi:hypothetical protein